MASARNVLGSAASRNWRFLVGRALSSARKSRPEEERSEWRRFSPEMKRVLFNLMDPMVEAEAALADPAAVVDHFKTQENSRHASKHRFLIQCLLVCMESPDRKSKFDAVFALAEKAVADGQLDGPSLWPAVFAKLFNKAIEMESARDVKELLEMSHDSQPPKLHGSAGGAPKSNDASLLKACEKDSYELVRPFLARGYRLRLDDFSASTGAKTLGAEEPPSEHSSLKERRRRLRGDQVRNLYVLRQMSKPSYILGCYKVICDEFYENRDRQQTEVLCQCNNQLTSFTSPSARKDGDDVVVSASKNNNARDRQLGLNDLMRFETSEEVFHFCPDNDKFAPNPDCQRHIECNDPVYRCFDLAHFASENSKRKPEFRTEYREVADACRQLAVDLLGQCRDSEEIETLLEEKSASVKYFGQRTPFLRYPRMRLAIEHSHKEFVGHVYCQQLFRQEINGTVAWEGRNFLYKLAHFLLQVVLAPLYILRAIFVQTGRSFRLVRGKHVPPVERGRTVVKRLYYRYLRYCDGAVLNLDAPLNKFLTMLGYYFIFLVMMIFASMRPLSVKVSSDNGFTWYHKILLLYSVSMLFQDTYSYFVLKAISHFFNYWRFFDLMQHVLLFTSLLLRLVMVTCFPCDQQEETFVFVCDDDIISTRALLETLSTSLFAVAAVNSGMRLLYFMQMHDRLGPIIINLSRVMLDIMTMLTVYVLMVLAFSTAFVYMLSSEKYVSSSDAASVNKTEIANSSNSTSEAHDEVVKGYIEIVAMLFWSILNPGPQEDLASDETLAGLITAILYAMFQVLAVIVFLNLLIATMNSTVNKVETNRELYWKFTRTSIWMDYFEVSALLPPPFTILMFFWMIAFNSVFMFERIRRWYRKKFLETDLPHHTGCKNDGVAFESRRKQAYLLYELSQKYLQSRRERKRTNNMVKKEDLDKLKREMLDELLACIRKENQHRLPN